jgi:hypothetical protein
MRQLGHVTVDTRLHVQPVLSFGPVWLKLIAGGPGKRFENDSTSCISAVPTKRMFVKFHNGNLGENSLSWAYGAVEMKPRIA